MVHALELAVRIGEVGLDEGMRMPSDEHFVRLLLDVFPNLFDEQLLAVPSAWHHAGLVQVVMHTL